ncbi:WYL domain-containing protein [Caenimonas sedimenti]|uniref:WYL domain-containing protein n=1 Tax=Caenimonas sedimenti TaxID=2596921 RepID=A0A562ZM17_9BURK|nr:WYL domain-containing protein [Caenimonas sedimenti]TWO69457.1 WYL domain-containing protein [Caenimonas sedimenti]
MRASRLLSIQMLLETRGRMSATALAGALEVSVRTLHRDIDELSAAGVPVFAERGRHGGFALLPGWKTTLTGLTPSEAEAVFLSGLAGPAADLGLGAHVKSAQLKVMASLPPQMQGSAGRISSRFHLDPIDWYREADALPHLAAVSQAVWEERQLSMAYESWAKTASRVVHPLGLVLKAGVWYLVAAREGEPRTYRVSNMLQAEVLEAAVARPRNFDLPAYWRAAVRRFETELFTGEAEVAATEGGLAQLRRLGAAQARAVAAAKPSRRKDGRTVLRVPIESTEHAAGQMLRLAPEVEVLGPAKLRAAIVGRLEAARKLYGPARAPGVRKRP